MKKLLSAAIAAILTLTAGGLISVTTSCSSVGTTYYISASRGDDSASGKSESQAWKSFENVKNLVLNEGDRLLLRRGDEWNERLTVRGCGTAEHNAVISSYGSEKEPLPMIKLGGGRDDICMVIADAMAGTDEKTPKIVAPSYITVENLAVGNAAVGIYARVLMWSENRGLTVRNCEFYDIRCESVLKGMDKDNTLDEYIALRDEVKGNLPRINALLKIEESGGGAGEWAYATALLISGVGCRSFDDVTVENLVFYNCIAGAELHAVNAGKIENCVATGSYAGVFRMSGCTDVRVNACRCIGGSEDYTFFGGTCGGFVGGCAGVNVENCEFAYEYNLGAPDGCGFDYETRCENTVIRNSVLHHNSSGGVLIMPLNEQQHSNVGVKSCLFYSNIQTPANYKYGFDVLLYNRAQSGVYITDNFFFTDFPANFPKSGFIGNAEEKIVPVTIERNSEKSLSEWRSRYSFNAPDEGAQKHTGKLEISEGKAILTPEGSKAAIWFTQPQNGFSANNLTVSVTSGARGKLYCQYDSQGETFTGAAVSVGGAGVYSVPLGKTGVLENIVLVWQPEKSGSPLALDYAQFTADISVAAEKTGDRELLLTFTGKVFPVLALYPKASDLKVGGVTPVSVAREGYNRLRVTMPDGVGSVRDLSVSVSGNLFLQYFADMINGLDAGRTAADDAKMSGGEVQSFFYNGSIMLKN